MKMKSGFLTGLLFLLIVLLAFFGGYLWRRQDDLEKQVAALSTQSPVAVAAPSPTQNPPFEENPASDKEEAPTETPQPTVAVQPGIAGSDWEEVTGNAPFGARREIVLLVFQDKLWVIGGLGETDVWCSEDGEHWKQTCPNAGFALGVNTGAAFNGKMWVMSDGGVWNSPDGRAWSKVAGDVYGERRNATLTVFKDRLWMIGGGNWMSNDVWVSDNGIQWTCAVKSAPFAPRRAHTALVFDGKLWVRGGMGGDWSHMLNDNWCSEDGTHWLRKPSTPFIPRCAYSEVEFRGRMLAVGGDAGNFHYLNDAWASPDGEHWQELASSAGFRGRGYHRCVVFKDRIWLVAGDAADVWCTPPRNAAKGSE